jgi:hypothetical protein
MAAGRQLREAAQHGAGREAHREGAVRSGRAGVLPRGGPASQCPESATEDGCVGQSVRAAAGVPKTTTGLDANKKASGRKRGLAVDVLGLIIGVVVLAASAHDNAAGTALLDQAAERCGMRLEKVLVDQGFKDEVLIHGALLDIDVEVVRRNPADQGKGFVPQPKRWIVEQVNGTLLLHRRLAREYDDRPGTSVSRVYWASIANMTRRLTTPSPAWRDTLGLAA